MSAQALTGQDSISVTELAAWRRNRTPHVLLDVREPPERAICALEDSLHIAMGEIPARVSELPAELPLVVLCHHGMRSLRVVQFLRQNGRPNAINLDGGIDAWAAEIEPGIGRY